MPSPFKSLAASLPRTVELDYFPPLVNPLVVSAGPDQHLNDGLVGTLNGSAYAANSAAVTLLWTLVSGPGTVVFTDDSAAVTGFEVSESGVYVFKLTASITGWSLSDEATVAVDPLPVPVVAMDTVSEAGNATLCGFVEISTPSTPPKKYRTGTLSGSQYFCVRGCVANDPNNAGRKTWMGGLSFNAATCAKTITGKTEDYTTANDGNCGVVRNAGGDVTFVNNDFFNGGNEDIPTVIPLEANATFPATCTSGPAFKECGYPVGGQCFFNAYKWEGFARIDLTDEDTEYDAIARVVGTPGTSATAQIEPRGAGDFTFAFVAVSYDLNLSNLVAGLEYRVTVDLLTEDYGGGNPVTTQQEYTFTAAGTTHTISDSIVCPSGKQVTVQNPTATII